MDCFKRFGAQLTAMTESEGVPNIHIECGLCHDLLMAFEIHINEVADEFSLYYVDVFDQCIFYNSIASQPGSYSIRGYIDVLDLVDRGILEPIAISLPLVVSTTDDAKRSFPIEVDWQSLKAKIEIERSLQHTSTGFFCGQDNLPIFIKMAQEEKNNKNFDLALGILDAVLKRYPNHRVALINKELVASLHYVDRVIAGHIIRVDTPKSQRLSVGLCLFDRPQEGREALCNILFQSSALEEHVEVVIGDNGDNESEVAAILKAFPQVKYTKRPYSIGVDQNMFLVYLEASAAFVYIIGDDDLLYHGSLAKIVSVISLPQSPSFGLLYFVPHIIDPSLRSLNRGNYEFTLSPSEDLTIVERDMAVEAVKVGFLRLSSLVYRKHAHIDTALQHLIGFNLFPLATALSALNKGLCCAINTPLYAYRQQTTSSWSLKASVIFYQWQPQLFYALGKSGDLAMKAVTAVFNHLQIDFDAWRSRNDPDFISATIASKTSDEKTARLIVGLVEAGALKANPDLDLLASRHLFDVEGIGLAHPSCLRFDPDGMMLHASDRSRSPSTCRLQHIPVAAGSRLELSASVPALAQGPVTYRIEIKKDYGEHGPGRLVSFDVVPGDKREESIDIGVMNGFYSIIFSTQMSEVERSCEYAWSMIHKARLVTSTSLNNV